LIIGITQTSQFVSPIVGIPDVRNKELHSLFYSCHQKMARLFCKKKQLLIKVQEEEDNDDKDENEYKEKDDDESNE